MKTALQNLKTGVKTTFALIYKNSHPLRAGKIMLRATPVKNTTLDFPCSRSYFTQNESFLITLMRHC
jgi:hypothetical protein